MENFRRARIESTGDPHTQQCPLRINNCLGVYQYNLYRYASPLTRLHRVVRHRRIPWLAMVVSFFPSFIPGVQKRLAHAFLFTLLCTFADK